jgi:TPR repeat protein
MIVQTDCWEEAYKLIASGKVDEAMALCENSPCAQYSIECQRYLGWNKYENNDLGEALFWFNKAAEKNDAESLYGIGSIYFIQGEFESALCNYRKSLDCGYKRAAYWIGYMHEHGLGIEKDVESAKKYYDIGYSYGYLMAKRASIRLVFKTGSINQKMLSIPSLLYVIIQSFFIAKKDIDDERLADIPNAFKQYRK